MNVPKTPDEITEPVQDWYFTFGQNHKDIYSKSLLNSYVVIKDTFTNARWKVFNLRATSWSNQYASAEEAGVERYNLTQVSLDVIDIKPIM